MIRVALVLTVFASDCMPVGNGGLGASTTRPDGVPRPAVSPLATTGETNFLGTVTSVDPGNSGHPYLKWVVTLKIDKVVSGPSPGEGFWFAIHSPSQDEVEVGQHYRLTVKKDGDSYALLARDRVN